MAKESKTKKAEAGATRAKRGRGKAKAAKSHDETRTRKSKNPKLVIRPLQMGDIDAIQALHHRCFPGIEPFSEEHLAAQLERFAEGQIGVELDGALVATSSSLILHSDDVDVPHTYHDVSDDGLIRAHDPTGDTLYGIDIAVHPDVRGWRLARRIYDARKELVTRMNLRRIVVAGRIPGFQAKARDMEVDDYVRLVVSKHLTDPVLTTQRANGFAVRGILKDYLPSDYESLGHAVLLEWLNPDFVPDHDTMARASVRVSAVQYQMRAIDS
ncbi:MAG: hypothetical protein KDA28_12705, partial [Phycisphaerales bacterium]|nr:hypothetical protein [Phycisphaerales bacterium]